MFDASLLWSVIWCSQCAGNRRRFSTLFFFVIVVSLFPLGIGPG